MSWNDQNDFEQWWDSLPEFGNIDGHTISREAAKAVWEQAQALYEAKIDLVGESLSASTYLANTLPVQDVAFIADQFHGGRIAYRVDDRIKWHSKLKRVVRTFNSRTRIVTVSVQPDTGLSRHTTKRRRQ